MHFSSGIGIGKAGRATGKEQGQQKERSGRHKRGGREGELTGNGAQGTEAFIFGI